MKLGKSIIAASDSIIDPVIDSLKHSAHDTVTMTVYFLLWRMVSNIVISSTQMTLEIDSKQGANL